MGQANIKSSVMAPFRQTMQSWIRKAANSNTTYVIIFLAKVSSHIATFSAFFLIGIIGRDHVIPPRVVDTGNNDNFWETVIFPTTLRRSRSSGSTSSSSSSGGTSVKAALATAKDNHLLDAFDTPHVLIITATTDDDIFEEDLTPEHEFVMESMLRIDVLTFAGQEHQKLMPLTRFGQFYAGMLKGQTSYFSVLLKVVFSKMFLSV